MPIKNTVKTDMKENLLMRDYTENPRISGDYATPDAYERFLQENIGLIHKVLNPYRGLDDYDDLFQEACLGIFKALLTYDSSRGTKLTSYAFTCAQNQVRMYLRTNNAKCRAGESVSLETWDGNIENQNRLLESILSSRCQLRSEEGIDNKVYMRLAFQAAMGVVKNELDKTAQITIYRFIDGAPQNKTAEMLGISQSAVSKAFTHALVHLRARMTDLGFVELA